MNDAIQVKDAIKALRMLKDVGEKATFGPWRSIGYGVIRGGPLQQYTNGMADDQIASVTIPNRDEAAQIRDANTDFIVMARAALPGMVEYLLHGLSRHRPHDKLGAGVLYDAIAPIVQWARTREDWSR